MGSKQLDSALRDGSQYFANRKVWHLAKRLVSATLIYFGLHMWGLNDVDKAAYWLASAVIIGRLERQ